MKLEGDVDGEEALKSLMQEQDWSSEAMEWGEENSMTCKQEMIDWYGWVLAFKLEFFQVLHASPHLTKNFQLKAFGSLMGLNESEYLGQNTELARDEMLYEMQMKTIKTINIWATLNYSEGQSTTWHSQTPTNLPKSIIKSSKTKIRHLIEIY